MVNGFDRFRRYKYRKTKQPYHWWKKRRPIRRCLKCKNENSSFYYHHYLNSVCLLLPGGSNGWKLPAIIRLKSAIRDYQWSHRVPQKRLQDYLDSRKWKIEYFLSKLFF